jgi:hypothetical protein
MERPEARAKGLTRYTTGRPCKHGHITERMVSSGTCCECLLKTVASNKHRSEEAIARRADRKAQKQREGKSNHSKKKWRENNPKKVKASQMVNNAVRDGRLDKPDECSSCGSKAKLVGHHSDYDKPLEVEWLCSTCHRQIHLNHTSAPMRGMI